MSKKLPVVAIVGRANVGKSSLFNALLRKKEAVVAREAGTTRDAVYRQMEFNDKAFWLVDTAGLKSAEDEFEATIQQQIIEAAAAADVIIVVVEAQTMITDEDRRVAKQALKSKKPVILVTNKIDQVSKSRVDEAWERLGIKTIIGTSTMQNLGIRDLLSSVSELLPARSTSKKDDSISVALLGRPNVGKSALFNALAKKQQAIVANLAGTTRDVNKLSVRFNNQTINLLDTAGLRRPGKIEKGIEQFSVLRSLSAIEEADICLLLMDVNDFSTHLDQKIAGLIKEAGKGLVIVVSKWDSLDKTPYSRDSIAAKITSDFDFVPWAPLIFTSSETGQNVTKLFELVLEIDKRRRQTFKTTELNKILSHCVDSHPPAGLKGRHPKPRYMVQDDINPPTLRLYGAHLEYLHWSWKRYLEKALRREFDLVGTPIKLYVMNNERKSGKTKKYLPKKDPEGK